MPLGRDRGGWRCWNLFVLDLAGNSNHRIIPFFFFFFMYCRLNMSIIHAGPAIEVDPEADKNKISKKWEKALWPPSFTPHHLKKKKKLKFE